MRPSFTPYIFGEVLFDCFPDGSQVLGGAPFNVAWHLQAFGDRPHFISRVGDDTLGKNIIGAMTQWGMDTSALQHDGEHATGQVIVEFTDDEPHYTITPDSAYDFISAEELPEITSETLLYHGTLAIRNTPSRQSLQKLSAHPKTSLFLDVNLRKPWWDKDSVLAWLGQARWAKLNEAELRLLSSSDSALPELMCEFRRRYEIEVLVVTLGEEGAVACTADGQVHSVKPAPLAKFVDTVGAGDAFTAVTIHGLLHDWPLSHTLDQAQKFASAVVGMRGATTADRPFYTRIDIDG